MCLFVPGRRIWKKTVDDFYDADIAVSIRTISGNLKVMRQRLITVLEDIRVSRWKAASPATLKSFTSAGYFFAKDLYANTENNRAYQLKLWCSWWPRPGMKQGGAIDFPALYSQIKSKPVQSKNLWYYYNACGPRSTTTQYLGVSYVPEWCNRGRAYKYRIYFHASSYRAIIVDWRQKFNQGTCPFICEDSEIIDPVRPMYLKKAHSWMRKTGYGAPLPNTAVYGRNNRNQQQCRS